MGKFGGIQYVQGFVGLLHAIIAVDGYPRSARFSALGRDQYYAVGGPRAVNGRSRSVFQYFDRLNIIGIDGRKGTHIVDAAAVGNLDTVYYI